MPTRARRRARPRSRPAPNDVANRGRSAAAGGRICRSAAAVGCRISSAWVFADPPRRRPRPAFRRVRACVGEIPAIAERYQQPQTESLPESVYHLVDRAKVDAYQDASKDFRESNKALMLSCSAGPVRVRAGFLLMPRRKTDRTSKRTGHRNEAEGAGADPPHRGGGRNRRDSPRRRAHGRPAGPQLALFFT